MTKGRTTKEQLSSQLPIRPVPYAHQPQTPISLPPAPEYITMSEPEHTEFILDTYSSAVLQKIASQKEEEADQKVEKTIIPPGE